MTKIGKNYDEILKIYKKFIFKAGVFRFNDYITATTHYAILRNQGAKMPIFLIEIY